MKELFQKLNTLRFSLPFIMLLCWLIPTALLGSFMGTQFFRALQEKTEAFLTTGAEQAQVRTLENISKVITLAKDAVYDGELATAVSSLESDQMAPEIYFRACRNYLEGKYGREALSDFALFFRSADPDSIFFTSDDFQEAQLFQQTVQPTVLELSEQLDTRCYFYEQNGRVYLIRNLYNNRLEKFGMLLVGINTSELFSPILEWSAKWDASYSILLDSYHAGDLSHMEREDGLSEQDELLLYTLTTTNRDYEFRFQVQADKRIVYQEMDAFRTLMIWMFVLVPPLCLLIMYFVNRRIIRPVEILSNASTRIQNGELGITVPMRGKDELGQLGKAFSAMSLRLQTLVDQSYKGEIALRDARIQAMQSRINPHFLNNALETINWQARIEESETVSTMVEALSLLLNASMDRGEQHLVPLQEELNIADAYFYFVSLRFGDRLTIWKDVQDGLSRQLVPRLVIQTLIENAIQHGIEPAGGGRIRMAIYKQMDSLLIEITNNGRKLSEQDRKRITTLLGDDSDDGGHLGIRNVALRLRLLYGKQASLTISSDAHGETVAAIRLPLQEQEDRSHLE